MQFFYNFSDALFAFMQRGGDVLYLIGLLAFVMWFLILKECGSISILIRTMLESQWQNGIHDKIKALGIPKP